MSDKWNSGVSPDVNCPSSISAAKWLPLLLLLIFPVALQAQDFTYTSDGSGITITGYIGTGGAVIIPNTIEGLPVTSIGNSAFQNETILTSVTIPDSVITIGDHAFYLDTSLTSVTIPDSVTSIGNSAFSFCSSLTSITVDAANAAYSSDEGVLFNKDKTTLIQCPGGKVGSYTIPDSVTTIGEEAFYRCNSLTSITIPDSVTSIGGGRSITAPA